MQPVHDTSRKKFMSENHSSVMYSKRFVFSIIWIALAIFVAIFFAVSRDMFGPLITIGALAPILLLLLHKVDVASQRTLRDNSYLKEKVFKAAVNAEKGYKEVKAVRSRTRIVSARNTRILERMNKLNKALEEIPAEFESLQHKSQESNQHEHAIAPLPIHDEVPNDLRTEWKDFLSEYSRISHFNSTSHSTLTSVQQTEISRILDIYDVSNVLLVGVDLLTTYDRYLIQRRITYPLALSFSAPDENEPFVVISDFDGIKRLCDELKEAMLTFNAAFIVPSPLTLDEIESLGFARIPSPIAFHSVELIAPQELVGNPEVSTAD